MLRAILIFATLNNKCQKLKLRTALLSDCESICVNNFSSNGWSLHLRHKILWQKHVLHFLCNENNSIMHRDTKQSTRKAPILFHPITIFFLKWLQFAKVCVCARFGQVNCYTEDLNAQWSLEHSSLNRKDHPFWQMERQGQTNAQKSQFVCLKRTILPLSFYLSSIGYKVDIVNINLYAMGEWRFLAHHKIKIN